MDDLRRDGTVCSVRRIAVCAAAVWVALMVIGVLRLAHSQASDRRAITARMRERVSDGAGVESLYVRSIQQRERTQALTWLRGRAPDYEDLKLASGAMGATAALLLGDHGQLLQVLPARSQLLGTVLPGKYAHLRAAGAGQDAVSNVILPAARSLPVVGFATAFQTATGRRVFSPTFSVSSTPLGLFVGHALTLPGRQVYLIDATGKIIAATGQRLLRGITLSARNPTLGALIAHRPGGSYASPRGRQVYATAAVAGTPWRLVGTEPAHELYASVQGAGQLLAWFALGGLALAGLLIIGIGARLSESRDTLRSQTAELDRLARIDPLTGISNRRDLLDTLQVALDASRRDRLPVAVLMFDLDHFKRINDSLGHDVGDTALIAVARSMRTLVRQGDSVGRWGGEEFLAVLPRADAETALLVAERLRADIADNAAVVDGRSVTVTVGGAVSHDGDTLSELINRADAALYQGKRAGRNIVRLTGAVRSSSRARDPATPIA